MTEVIYKHIDSEAPEHHWAMLHVKNRVILDLGCGRNASGLSTPEYFLSKGAKKVYGVELSHSEKPYFDSLGNPKLKVFLDAVVSEEQLHYYLMLLEPEVIKMDIEGYERILGGMDAIDMAPVLEMAIEYHSQGMRHLIEHNYIRLGFQHIRFYSLPVFDPEHQGVICLKK